MDKHSSLSVLDRVCLIIIAVIFYLAIRLVQTAHDDLASLARTSEKMEQRISDTEIQIKLLLSEKQLEGL